MFGEYVNFLEKNMDVTALKRNVISNNISNYNTPGFKASKVNFEHIFNNQNGVSLKRTNDHHIAGSVTKNQPHIVQDLMTKERFDGNNVDLNVEMMDMIKNNSHHTKAVQAINKEFMLNRLALGK